MTPEEKAKFWTEVYIAAVRSFEVGLTLGGHGTAIKQVTQYAAACADHALEELNQRLSTSAHFQ